VHASWIPAVIGALFFILLLVQRIIPRLWGSKSILTAVGTTGFAEITIEVVTLLGFQAIHGYVYYKIATIIMAFMVGLALGAAWMRRIIERTAVGRRAFLIVQLLVCLYPIILLAVLLVLSRSSQADTESFMSMLHTHVTFPLMAFLAGFVGGLQFPLATSLLLAETPGTARVAGRTYGVDLLGSCLGALLTTTLLIPVFGIPYACVTASLLNLGSFLLVLMHRSPQSGISSSASAH
jgi:predicted membrane-bound spermidine synthase